MNKNNFFEYNLDYSGTMTSLSTFYGQHMSLNLLLQNDDISIIGLSEKMAFS